MRKDLPDTPIEIIRCNTEDALPLSEIAIRSYKDFYLYLWHDNGEWYVNRSFSPPVFEKELRDPNHAFFFLKQTEKLVGFLKMNINQPLHNYEKFDCIELERIYLVRSATGKGHGHKVVEFCFEYARKLNKQLIWLKAMDSSEAVFFYEKLGFERCGSFQLDFPKMKKEFRGMVIMMKKL
ncbi:MAG: GNAT family N-acetyltransferase [Bacteroidetes bacterium]|nr:MAG: GNAT family N-acetyltransferase [Bacteroidota bacterium]